MQMNDRAKEGRAHDRKSLEIFYEFQWRSLVQTVELLSKAVTYYFAILAALVGYLFTAKLTLLDQQLISRVIFFVSGFFMLLAIAMSYGILRGIADMKNSLTRYNLKVFQTAELHRYFRRGQFVGIVVVASSLSILVTICVALALKFFA